MSAPPPRTVYNQTQKTQTAFPHVQSKVLGVIQIIIGVLCFIFMVVSLAFGDIIGFMGHGIWNGIMFIITGSLGVSASRKKTKCSIIGFMVMCVISAGVTISLLALGIMGTTATSYKPSPDYGCTTSAYGNSDCFVSVSQPDVVIAMEACMAILAVIEVIVAIWGSAISCGAVCCSGDVRVRRDSGSMVISPYYQHAAFNSHNHGISSDQPESRSGATENLTDSYQISPEVFVTEAAKLVLNKVIGGGGFGMVYKAHHTDWGTVAYKKMNIGYVKTHERSSLEKEARIQHSLTHPNIVKLLALVCEPNIYGLVLEYMENGDMKDYLEMNPLSWEKKLYLVEGVVLAMSYLHSQNIIHGDLKMQNVLIDGNSNAKVCDFGLSLWKEYTATHSKFQQRGTPSHFPPEFLQTPNLQKSEQFDVYGFGIFLWQTMTQLQPFATVNWEIIINWVLGGQRPPLELVPKDIPGSSVALMERCWNQVPEKRPSFPEIKIQVEQEIGMLGSKSNPSGIQILTLQQAGVS